MRAIPPLPTALISCLNCLWSLWFWDISFARLLWRLVWFCGTATRSLLLCLSGRYGGSSYLLKLGPNSLRDLDRRIGWRKRETSAVAMLLDFVCLSVLQYLVAALFERNEFDAQIELTYESALNLNLPELLKFDVLAEATRSMPCCRRFQFFVLGWPTGSAMTASRSTMVCGSSFLRQEQSQHRGGVSPNRSLRQSRS